jgi:hypothetical protein
LVPKHQVAICRGNDGDKLELPEQAVRTLTEFETGFLVGYNSGEWGGGLYWYGRDGALLQHILEGNIVRVVPVDGKVLVFSGIAHLVMNEGQASVLEFDGSSWTLLYSLDLTGAPVTFADEPDGTLLVATSKRIVRLSNARRVEVLYRSKTGHWPATSMVRDDDGTLYLGGRYVVVRLRPLDVGYVETWLAPSGATRPPPPEAERY